MARDADSSYSAYGPRPFGAIRTSRIDIAIEVLAATARDYRAEAKRKARLDAADGEGPDHIAELCEALVPILRGEAPAALPTLKPAGPVEHRCEECGGRANSGFGPYWACFKHAAAIEARWQGEETARKARAAEILNRKPSTDLSGLPGKLI